MLDSHHYHAGGAEHHHQHDVTITEKRAPTDESVKLLREMEDKALANVLATARLEPLGTSCVVHYMRDPINDVDRFIVRYRLGVDEHSVKHESFRRGENEYQRTRRLFAELSQALAQDMAERILEPAMANAMPKILGCG